MKGHTADKAIVRLPVFDNLAMIEIEKRMNPSRVPNARAWLSR
jgi:hypothetical protein